MNMYKKYLKRLIDIILSFLGLVLLSWVFLLLIILIKIDDPGPAFFTQKRIGIHKKEFKLHKFRSMKMDTPHDMPTHMLSDPDQYITGVGRFLRKSSLDELPQIWDIFVGNMSIIGPRPALWNQTDLIAERDRYGANDIKPGLTGWAQINGRDELEIPVKAKLDGEYVEKLSFGFDVKCFIGTVFSVIRSDGVVEGGTGELQKQKNAAENEPLKQYPCVGVGKGERKTIMVLSCHTQSLFWFRLEMMKSFITAGYQVVAVGQLPEEEWKDQFSLYGIRYRQLDAERNGTNPLRDLGTLKKIETLMEQEKPDILFCYQAKTVIYGSMAAHKKGITEIYPLIAGLGSVLIGSGFKNGIVKFLMITEYKLALKYAKTVMFQNPDDLAFFTGHRIVKKEKCRIINGSGVDTQRFVPTPLPQQTAFLCISRLIRDKGVGEYLEAARLLHKKYPPLRCLLVGPYDTNPSAITPEELASYIEDGSVEYFGEQTDIIPYMSMCSVFVLPSYHEGTPKTVLEAMASGRAVITTDAPGCRETVTDGKNGLLVPVRDTVALASAMESLVADSYRCIPMGMEGRRLAVEKYDVRKVNQDIMNIMDLSKSEGFSYVTL